MPLLALAEPVSKPEPDSEDDFHDAEEPVPEPATGPRKLPYSTNQTDPRPNDGRCEARIWYKDENEVASEGLDRCRRSNTTPSSRNGLCPQHASLDEKGNGCEPFTLVNGLHSGLWHGRINEYQQGEPGIPPYKNANNQVIVCVKHTGPIMRAYIRNEIACGRATGGKWENYTKHSAHRIRRDAPEQDE